MYRWALGLCIACGISGCRIVIREGPPQEQVDAIERTLDELYRSFNFDAGGEADWTLMRSLLVDGACFLAPLGEKQRAKAVGTDQFIDEFRAWVRSDAQQRDGFHERLVNTRIDVFGKLAHAYVLFEGFVPGDGETKTRGLDSIQFALDGETWRVVSFTTQYANPKLPIPQRFEQGG